MSAQKSKSNQSLEVPTILIYIGKLLEKIAPTLAIKFAAKLFVTPIKHKTPKREWHMDEESKQKMLFIPKLNKSINLYFYGSGTKKILLVHGWSGRGTQLVKIADALKNKNFEIISFDAPAHGKSEGKTSIMTEFIASILEIEKVYGPFDYAIGHSLGGMSILNSIKQGFKVQKIVSISAGDIIQDIIDDFIAKLKMKPTFGIRLKHYFEAKYNEKMDNYSAHKGAIECKFPTLIIHDENDEDVSIKAAHNLIKNLSNGELLITKNLGHRKILGDKEVIQRIVLFLE